MTCEVKSIVPLGSKPARAVQIPEVLSDDDIDDVLYSFGFEYFGPGHGTQRLVHITDDSIDEYDDAEEVMRRAGASLAIYVRDAHAWTALLPGDWVVEPPDDRGDGFIKLSDSDFRETYEVVDR